MTKRWLVVCFGANDWTICNSEEDLGRTVGRLWLENVKRDAKAEGQFGSLGAFPVHVYELGQRVNVRLKDFEVKEIEPVKDAE